MGRRMRWGDLLEKIYGGMLSPSQQACIICKRSIRMNDTALRPLYPYEQSLMSLVCYKCVNLIPWIRELGCAYCGRAIRCPDCQRHPLRNDGLRANRSVVRYDEQMKQWLSQYKFKGDRVYELVMVRMMQLAYEPLLSTVWERRPSIRDGGITALFQGKLDAILPDLITYVPSTRERIQVRGFNQAEQFAWALGREWGRPVVELLARTQDAEKQSKQSRIGRERSISNAFKQHQWAGRSLQEAWGACKGREGSNAAELRVLLIDDVYTTGSTIRAYSRKLSSLCRDLDCPVSIVSYTWARA
ncbi:ComF family protein [Paenibacillus sp. NAIST15-1]|uniref:ComF family protein n=1 Tax=Paenibacillus sp. NAIST15-1 TaxID=1605994 RepID=UPI000934D844|nr:ComF family protein [Paenibacillus sp. NAIST15-1]